MSVLSLFSICLGFVASNINYVESFIRFPESIGKQIFQVSAIKGQFNGIKNKNKYNSNSNNYTNNNRAIAKSNLKIFFDAYGECGILEHLCLRQCHLFVNDVLLDCPWLLKYLSSLDLSLCGLGDDHELLPHIVTFLSLEVLSLQANCLTDEGIRKLTTPLRFHGKTHGLKYIDLSSNKITGRALRFLKAFIKLCAIDVTDNTIKNEPFDIGQHFSTHNDCSCSENLFHVTTDGWAKGVVDCWKQEYHEIHSIQPLHVITTSFPNSLNETYVIMNAKSFYHQRKPATYNSSVVEEKSSTNKCIIITEHFHCSRKSIETCSSGLSYDLTNQTRNRMESHNSQTKGTMLMHQKHIKLSPQRNRKRVAPYSFSSSLSVSAFSNDMQPSMKNIKLNNNEPQRKNTFCDEDNARLFGSKFEKNIVHNGNRIEGTEIRSSVFSPPDISNDLLAFYTEAETKKSGVEKSNKQEKKKSLFEELNDWA